MKYSMLKLDVFRKMPKDLTEPTFCGAVGKKYLHLIFLLFSFYAMYRFTYCFMWY